eukprot:CAMPEP_0175634142 /NCGR_PEP_ID=MMETSP0097-20121207/1019_1 /TAXON_ID=311494 /ORGANISM="Alexandrium monilatum, Strain CCMP3105" /LENGTH=225 /DNA_ID=CAMNT_0016939731 /DNA_START=130 /DNA_END=805 /DNA_ORIENTATION=+
MTSAAGSSVARGPSAAADALLHAPRQQGAPRQHRDRAVVVVDHDHVGDLHTLEEGVGHLEGHGWPDGHDVEVRHPAHVHGVRQLPEQARQEMPHGNAHDDAVGVQHGEARVRGAAEQLLNAFSLCHERDTPHEGVLREDVLHAQGLGDVLGPAVWQEGKGGHVDQLVVEAVVDAVPQHDSNERCHPSWSYHHGVSSDLDHHDSDGQRYSRAAAQECSSADKGPDA